uniref:Uncharacterized protein n=1 Tax=Ignisphaera aggregans TaxID=334771 RepID=A0A7J2U1C0_9CREN
MSESLEEIAKSYEEKMREYIEKRFLDFVDIMDQRHLFELKSDIAELLGEEPKSVRISTYWKQEMRETDFELSATFERNGKYIACFVSMPVKSMVTRFTVSSAYREHYAQDITMELDKSRATVRCIARK